MRNYHERVTESPSGTAIIFKLGDGNLKFWHEAKRQFSHGGEGKVDSDPLPILESFWGVNRTFRVVQTADGWRHTLFSDEMPVPAVVYGILELHAVGVAEGLATPHAHFELQESRCRHVEVPGLSITWFSYKKGKSSMVARNCSLFAPLASVLVMNTLNSKRKPCLIWSDFSSPT